MSRTPLNSEQPEESPAATAPPPAAAVLSPSPLMRMRLSGPLQDSGFEVSDFPGLKAFFRHPRQRPFVVCFVDIRGAAGRNLLPSCKKARPGERYVTIRQSWASESGIHENGAFASLCEGFSSNELKSVAEKAVTDLKRSETAPPLEDLLYERFRDFLLHVGPSSVKDLHRMVNERVERPLMAAVMEWARGNQTKASEVLGIHRNTLRVKLKNLGLSGRLGRETDD